MRVAYLALALTLTGTPAIAQTAPSQPIQLPPQLSDPRVAEQLSRMSQALGGALLNLPVGEIEAAAEGRPVTPADRRRTVRDSAREVDPDFERKFQQQLANSRPMLESSMKALSTALPAMMQSLQQAGEALDRATANMPSPNYPKR